MMAVLLFLRAEAHRKGGAEESTTAGEGHDTGRVGAVEPVGWERGGAAVAAATTTTQIAWERKDVSVLGWRGWAFGEWEKKRCRQSRIMAGFVCFAFGSNQGPGG
jgi:hypothetical protein